MGESEIIELIRARDERGAEELLRHFGALLRYVIALSLIHIFSGSGTSSSSRTRPKLQTGAPPAAGRRMSSPLRRRFTAKR